MFADTHCHIYSEYYSDIDSVLELAKSNKVTCVINNGCDKKSNMEVMDLIEKYPNMYGAIGIHPENVDNYTEEDLLFIKKNIKNKKIIAIGEIGLDYHYNVENKNAQIELFEYQLKLASDNNIPVIIHSRDATNDTINILKKYKVKGVIHSFSGSYETAMIYIKMGFLLGINGIVTFKNCNLKEVLLKVGVKNIVLETDSPYLTPEPYRGTKNGPEKIYTIALFLANLFNISLNDLAMITNGNIEKLYKINLVK